MAVVFSPKVAIPELVALLQKAGRQDLIDSGFAIDGDMLTAHLEECAVIHSDKTKEEQSAIAIYTTLFDLKAPHNKNKVVELPKTTDPAHISQQVATTVTRSAQTTRELFGAEVARSVKENAEISKDFAATLAGAMACAQVATGESLEAGFKAQVDGMGQLAGAVDRLHVSFLQMKTSEILEGKVAEDRRLKVEAVVAVLLILAILLARHV